MRSYRQGDVLILAVKKRTPQGQEVRDKGRVILAYGEVTGHAHEVVEKEIPLDFTLPASQLFEEPNGERYLFVNRICTVTHQEHGPIELPPGCYKITRQREYSPEEIRNVAD